MRTHLDMVGVSGSIPLARTNLFNLIVGLRAMLRGINRGPRSVEHHLGLTPQRRKSMVSGWGSHLDHRGETASIDYDEFVPAEGPIISAEAEA